MAAANTTYYTAGNLALAPTPMRRLTVLEGGRSCHKSSARRNVEPSRPAVAPVAFFIAATLAVLVLASFVFDSYREALSSTSLAGVSTASVTVSPGQSLWSLAEDHAVEGATTADVMRWIKDSNCLEGSTLIAGERLIVPVHAD